MEDENQGAGAVDRSASLRGVLGWLQRWRWFAVFVILPSLLAAIYYGLIASSIYVSESRFVIKTPNEKSMHMSGLAASLMQGSGLSGGQNETQEIIGYLRSRDALKDLTAKADVRTAFAAPHADALSRFPKLFHNDSFEHLYQFYGEMVGASVDGESGTAILTVRAFDPESARNLNEHLLTLSEELVNRLNQRANEKTITEAQQQVRLAQERVRKARVALSQYRNSSELLDPEQQGMGVLSVSNALIAEESGLRAKLAEVERATPNHPSLPALRARVAALSSQIASQTGRAVGTPTGIASKLSGYERLTVEQEFATQMLNVANTSLEQARAEAVKQQYYLERVVSPNLPDEPLLPARLKSILAVVFSMLCLYLVGWMLVVGVLEHAPED